MGYIISVLGQKGGTGKSTVARLLATEFARQVSDGEGWSVKIADLDLSQKTSVEWAARRMQNGVVPEVRAEAYRVEKAMKDADHFDVLVIDGAPHATQDTLTAARSSQIILLPTGPSLDDLRPTVTLAHELKAHKIDMAKVIFVLTRTGKSDVEDREAREYIAKAGYAVTKGTLAEQIAYRRATDTGNAVSETGFKGLNDKAQALFGEMIAPISTSDETTQNEVHAA